MTAADFLDTVAIITLAVLSVAMLLVIYRIFAGPTLPDRIVALDLLVAIAIGFIATVALKTGVHAYLDIAIALGLLGFLTTVALARYVLTRGKAGDAEPPGEGRSP